MYPFASANLNALVIGNHNLDLAKRSITVAYLISLVGYLSIFAGGAIFNQYHYNSVIYALFIRPVKQTIGKVFEKVVINKRASRFAAYFYFIALALALFVAFEGGKGNDPRGFYAHNTQYQFLYNFVNSLSGLVSTFLIIRIFQFNHRTDKLLFAIFIVFTVFIGSRGGIIGPLVGFFSSYVYFKMKGKIKMVRVLLFVFCLLCLIVGLTLFRSGGFSFEILMSTFMLQIFYGNSFSDLRDFSWVLSLWKGGYFYGKTYLAAFMSFIPSSMSAFRTEWSIGKVTAVMAGYNPKEHPGMRPGMFGESFLNFGIVGVIFIGLLLGYSWRYIDYKVKEATVTGNLIATSTAGVACMIISGLPITAGFFGVYVNIVVFLGLYALRSFFITYRENAV
jgi:oligosaccharide repeat unit polymerase